MQKLREGANDFQLVGQRLQASSAALEQLTRFYESTAGETVRRSTSTLETVQSQLGALTDPRVAPEMVAVVNQEIRGAIDALASLNPLWPKSRPDS